MGAVNAGACGADAEGTGEDEREGSSGGDEGSLFASTRVGDFAGTTLGGLEELKNLPPGGFENRE